MWSQNQEVEEEVATEGIETLLEAVKTAVSLVCLGTPPFVHKLGSLNAMALVVEKLSLDSLSISLPGLFTNYPPSLQENIRKKPL